MKLRFPFYIRFPMILMGVSFIVLILYLGQNILMPLFVALFFAILLRPVVVLLSERLRMPPVLAVLITVIFFCLLVIGVVFFVSWQITAMMDDWNAIKRNLSAHVHHFQLWMMQHWNLSYRKQEGLMNGIVEEFKSNGTRLTGNTLNSFSNTLLIIFLIPIYTFLILVYRGLLTDFLFNVNGKSHHAELTLILVKIKTIVQGYIIGLLLEMLLVTGLTAGGLALLGVPYAVLLGVITGLMNLIPYVGIMAAGLLTIFATLISTHGLGALIGIIIVNVIVQVIDNNFIVPKIVASKVQINPLASMVGVISGGTIGGIAGMIISIPLIAIVKVIFDHVEKLKPFGILFGDRNKKSSSP